MLVDEACVENKLRNAYGSSLSIQLQREVELILPLSYCTVIPLSLLQWHDLLACAVWMDSAEVVCEQEKWKEYCHICGWRWQWWQAFLKINSYATELAWQLPRNELAIAPVSLKAWQVSVRNSGAKWTERLLSVLCWSCCQADSSYWGCLEGREGNGFWTDVSFSHSAEQAGGSPLLLFCVNSHQDVWSSTLILRR